MVDKKEIEDINKLKYEIIVIKKIINNILGIFKIQNIINEKTNKRIIKLKNIKGGNNINKKMDYKEYQNGYSEYSIIQEKFKKYLMEYQKNTGEKILIRSKVIVSDILKKMKDKIEYFERLNNNNFNDIRYNIQCVNKEKKIENKIKYFEQLSVKNKLSLSKYMLEKKSIF